MSDQPKTELEPELLKILACPICLGKFSLDEGRLRCGKCSTRFGIKDGGIPNMLVEEAELPPGVSSYKELDAWKEREKSSTDS